LLTIFNFPALAANPNGSLKKKKVHGGSLPCGLLHWIDFVMRGWHEANTVSQEVKGGKKCSFINCEIST
jgi:hypothetical protein